MDRKQLVYAVIGAGVVALAILAYFAFFGGTGNLGVSGDKLNIVLAPGEHTLGSPKAPVQWVEYAAPVCPHCAHWNETVFPQLKSTYIDTGKVYYVFRVFPLRSVDVAVEAMARCLPKDSYFQFIDMMFRNQSRWDPDGYNIPDVHAALINMGRIAGMSAEQVDTCISNQDELNKISAVGEHATKAYGINGTPTFIVNGELNKTAVTWQAVQDLVNRKLKEQKQAAAGK